MISLKSPAEVEIMKEGGALLAGILRKLREAVRPGISTKDLDTLASDLTHAVGATPAFLGYNDFPATLCVSLNEEVVHGVPSADRILKEGDLISLDMGIVHRGLNVDSALTLPVLGDLSRAEWAEKHPELNRLVAVTEESMYAGIKEAVPGVRLGKISWAVQDVIERNGFGVVRDLVGHGIGVKLHEEPAVPNFGNPHEGPVLREGMALAIEPMATAGDWRVKLGDDETTFVTADGSFAAHFEHTIVITADGPLILTR